MTQTDHDRIISDLFSLPLHPKLRKLIIEIIALNGPPGDTQHDRLIEIALRNLDESQQGSTGLSTSITLRQWCQDGYPILAPPKPEPTPPNISRISLLKDLD